MAKVLEKALAIKLRQRGYTYREILKVITDVSKGTISRWCNSIELTSAQLEKLEKKMQKGRDRARFQTILTNRKNREKRELEIRKISLKEFHRYKNEHFFAFGLALYWSEGSKKIRRFQFMNSDPKLIKLMGRWIERYMKIQKLDWLVRIYMHRLYDYEDCEGFWANILGIPKENFLRTIYKLTPHKVKRNQAYKGCVRIELRRVKPWLKVMNWQYFYSKLMRL